MSKKIYCSRRFVFDAAHRVIGHGGKCRFLHGHRYECEAVFVAEQLNDLGMVIDFGIIKEILGGWINENLDHNMILSVDDQQMATDVTNYTKQQTYFLKSNPTAENIAMHLLYDICPVLFAEHHVRCVKIKLKEGENSYVELEL